MNGNETKDEIIQRVLDEHNVSTELEELAKSLVKSGFYEGRCYQIDLGHTKPTVLDAPEP